MFAPAKKSHKQPHLLLEVIGWYGSFAIICALGLVSFGFINGQGYVFHLLTATGSASLLVISVVKKVYQPAVLNACMFIISVAALLYGVF